MNKTTASLAAIMLLMPAAGALAAESKAPVISGIIRNVNELGDILQKKHAVFDPEAGTNIAAAIIKAIDPYAEIMDAAQAGLRAEELQGYFYGVGISLAVKNKLPAVTEVLKDGPAEKAGIKPGSIIEKINGRKTENMPLESVVSCLRGAKDEKVTLTVRAGDGNSSTNEFELKRAVVHMPIAGVSEDWPYNMCFMRVNGLYENSGAQIVSQMVAWAATNCSGIIMDLRNAGGSDLQAAADIAGLFLPGKPPLINLRDGTGEAVASFTGKPAAKIDAPLMVLVNRETSGAAEALAAALSTGKGVLLIGAPTRGDDCQREFMPLSDGKIVYLATRRVEISRGVPYRRTGVKPHVHVVQADNPAPKAEEASGEEENGLFIKLSEEEKLNRALLRRTKGDAVLQRATDILLGLKALNIKGR